MIVEKQIRVYGRPSTTIVRRVTSLVVTLAAFALTAPSAHAADFKLVAHPDVSVSSLDSSDCSRIFLKKRQRWGDGTRIVPVDLSAASPVRRAFSRRVHHKPTVAVEAFWQKQLFTGQGVPPITLNSEADVIRYVKENPGAIGYVSPDVSTRGLKVIEVR